VSQRRPPYSGGRRPRGATLLELIVVLALLGLILAVAAPAFIVPTPPQTPDLGSALDAARRAAILRGEPVTLTVDDDGGWRVEGDASLASPPVVAGTLAASVGRLRVRVSANGTCVPEPIDGVRLPDWNATGCRPASSAEGPRP
jgi:prepilin-type N-terminal cleavage/methylation domain-containing protein